MIDGDPNEPSQDAIELRDQGYYIIKDVKVWGVGKGNTDLTNAKRDENGEMMISLVVDGFTEPIDFKSKLVPQIGLPLKGEVEMYTTQKGQQRHRFILSGDKVTTQDYIQAQWAMGQALMYAKDSDNLDEVEELARAYVIKANKIAEDK